MIGDLNDILGRFFANLPARWLPQSSAANPPSISSPIIAGLLSGPASALSWIYSTISYVALQTRIATATGFNLDVIALDYFGVTLSRRSGETDTAFSLRIRANLFLPAGTRQSVSNAVQILTGSAPKIFEPLNTHDTGGYASSITPVTYTGLAYGYAGGYGSFNYPYQMFVIAQRANASVNPEANVNGYGGYLSGYASVFNYLVLDSGAFGSGEYVNGAVNTGSVSDAEIYQTIAENMPAGTIAWTALQTPA